MKRNLVVFSKIIRFIFIVSICLFVFNSGDFHNCEEDSDHEPICNDCSCSICASGHLLIEMTGQAFDPIYSSSDHLNTGESNNKFDEFVVELDQPPRI